MVMEAYHSFGAGHIGVHSYLHGNLFASGCGSAELANALTFCAISYMFMDALYFSLCGELIIYTTSYCNIAIPNQCVD